MTPRTTHLVPVGLKGAEFSSPPAVRRGSHPSDPRPTPSPPPHLLVVLRSPPQWSESSLRSSRDTSRPSTDRHSRTLGHFSSPVGLRVSGPPPCLRRPGSPAPPQRGCDSTLKNVGRGDPHPRVPTHPYYPDPDGGVPGRVPVDGCRGSVGGVTHRRTPFAPSSPLVVPQGETLPFRLRVSPFTDQVRWGRGLFVVVPVGCDIHSLVSPSSRGPSVGVVSPLV